MNALPFWAFVAVTATPWVSLTIDTEKLLGGRKDAACLLGHQTLAQALAERLGCAVTAHGLQCGVASQKLVADDGAQRRKDAKGAKTSDLAPLRLGARLMAPPLFEKLQCGELLVAIEHVPGSAPAISLHGNPSAVYAHLARSEHKALWARWLALLSLHRVSAIEGNARLLEHTRGSWRWQGTIRIGPVGRALLWDALVPQGPLPAEGAERRAATGRISVPLRPDLLLPAVMQLFGAYAPVEATLLATQLNALEAQRQVSLERDLLGSAVATWSIEWGSPGVRQLSAELRQPLGLLHFLRDLVGVASDVRWISDGKDARVTVSGHSLRLSALPRQLLITLERQSGKADSEQVVDVRVQLRREGETLIADLFMEASFPCAAMAPR